MDEKNKKKGYWEWRDRIYAKLFPYTILLFFIVFVVFGVLEKDGTCSSFAIDGNDHVHRHFLWRMLVALSCDFGAWLNSLFN